MFRVLKQGVSLTDDMNQQTPKQRLTNGNKDERNQAADEESNRNHWANRCSAGSAWEQPEDPLREGHNDGKNQASTPGRELLQYTKGFDQLVPDEPRREVEAKRSMRRDAFDL